MTKEQRNNAIQILEAEIDRFHKSLIERSFSSNNEEIELLTAVADLSVICHALKKDNNTVKIIGSHQYPGVPLTMVIHSFILAGLSWKDKDNDINTITLSVS